jgi:nitrogen fixation/metabolism regulation signal transduction histidine kinase
MTIRKKLIVIQLVTAFVVLASGSAVFVVNAQCQFRTELVDNVSSTAELIGENTASTLQFLDSESAAQVLSTLRIEPHIANAAIYDESGQIFATYNRIEAEPFRFPEVAAATHAFEDRYLTLFRPILRGENKIGTVFMRSDLRQLDELINRYLDDVVEVFVLGALLSVLLAVLLQRAISAPILSLVRTTQNVSETGDYSRRAPLTTADELGSLSTSFNEMLEQIEKRDTSLQEARANLEERVQERTTDLPRAGYRTESHRSAHGEGTSRGGPQRLWDGAAGFETSRRYARRRRCPAPLRPTVPPRTELA